ncbi:hypothetical protein N9Y42_00295 [Mariniblastus sp.]|nr:hypothetical protein [Mariniblastus sp.]
MNQDKNNTQTTKTDVHPICQNSPTPEKCELFAEKLEQVNSNLEIHDPLASRI